MTNWISYSDANPDFFDMDKSIHVLVHSLPELTERWNKYINESYQDYSKERSDYVDIGEVSRFIIEKAGHNNKEHFKILFDRIEEVLTYCDSETENFIVIGLLEGIQNIASGQKINYWTGFDRWLGPKTKKAWDKLIFGWEGEDAIENYRQRNPGRDNLI